MKTKMTSQSNLFSIEKRTFIQNLPKLLKTNPGQYVAIQGKKILCIEKSEERTITVGQETAKEGGLLVQRIERIGKTLEKNRRLLEDHEVIKPDLTPQQWSRFKTNEAKKIAKENGVDPKEI